MVDPKKKGKENVTNRNKKPATSLANRKPGPKSKAPKRATEATTPDEPSKASFSADQEAEQILGCTEHSGQLLFLVKFKGQNEPQVVPARVANVRYPQKVINFYEKRIVWDDPN